MFNLYRSIENKIHKDLYSVVYIDCPQFNLFIPIGQISFFGSPVIGEMSDETRAGSIMEFFSMRQPGWYTIWNQLNTINYVKQLFRHSGGQWMVAGDDIMSSVYEELGDEMLP